MRAGDYPARKGDIMAQKKTYIYRVLIGNNGNVFEDIFLYARNAKVALDFCKEIYKDKKYNYYYANKVGLSHTLRNTEIITGYSAYKLRNSIAAEDKKFSEREVAMPEFIPVSEMGDS
jgi:hypothetical protein